MNDLIHDIMLAAARRFGGSDGTFNLAGFGVELCRAAGTLGTIDGMVGRVILSGRSDCLPLPGGAHYKVIK
jgi:hypothetical protein